MFHNQKLILPSHLPWPLTPSSSVPLVLVRNYKLRPHHLRGGKVWTIISTTNSRFQLTQVLILMKSLEPSLTCMLIWWLSICTTTYWIIQVAPLNWSPSGCPMMCLNNVPIIDAIIVYDYLFSGRTYLLVSHNALFVSLMTHNLIP